MWLKIKNEILQSSLITNISKIETVTNEEIVDFYDFYRKFNIHISQRLSFHKSGEIEHIIDSGKKYESVVNHVLKSGDYTGNLIDFSDINITERRSSFKLNNSKFIFTIEYDKINDDKEYKIYSNAYNTYEEADAAQNKFLSRLNEIDINVENIDI